MIIRELKKEDSQSFIQLTQQLAKETEFMLLTSAETNITVEKQNEYTDSMKNSDNRIVFVAEDNQNLIGFIGASRGMFVRNRHECHFAMGVLKTWWRKKVGTQLMGDLEDWAQSNGLIRIELTVMIHNLQAIDLYNKCGYQVEGVKKATIKVGNKLIDELLMAKLLKK
ncbi:GNAT family N-acetyltransferase [Beggiatoa alba]|nr:GNAT family N-acetyltransferase [Beggiatoa alba]